MEKGNEGRKSAGVFLRMTPQQRDLIDLFASQAGMTRSEYVVQCCAYRQNSFLLDARHVIDAVAPIVRIRNDGGPPAELDLPCTAPPRRAADNEVRDRRLELRISPYEKETIRSEAQRLHITMTEFVLMCCVYRPTPDHPVLNKDEVRKVYAELRAQGRNLNQIAAAANRIASVAWRDDIDAGMVDRLCAELTEDNERTRAAVNDALRAAGEAMRATRIRNGTPAGDDMAMIKTLARKHGGCENIMDYIEKEGACLAYDYGDNVADLSNWAREFDTVRADWGKDAGRKYYHVMISPDPSDGCDLETLRELATSWARERYPDAQWVIGYHDEGGRLHAHIAMNAVIPSTGYKIHMSDDDVEADAKALQDMCRARGLSYFEGPRPEPSGDGWAVARGARRRPAVALSDAERRLMARAWCRGNRRCATRWTRARARRRRGMTSSGAWRRSATR